MRVFVYSKYLLQLPVVQYAKSNAGANYDFELFQIIQAAISLHIFREIIIVDIVFIEIFDIGMQNGRTVLMQFFR